MPTADTEARRRARGAALRGLYAVTPDFADTDRLIRCVEAALSGGARAIQYRNKVADDALSRAQAAVAAGADYVAFGSFFPSTVKPDARRADVSSLARDIELAAAAIDAAFRAFREGR